MNKHPGLIGTKLGNTQIFEEDGAVRRVTVIQAGPCVVLAKRTEASPRRLRAIARSSGA